MWLCWRLVLDKFVFDLKEMNLNLSFAKRLNQEWMLLSILESMLCQHQNNLYICPCSQKIVILM